MLWIGILGIFTGVSLGILSCMKLVPYIMDILRISTGNMNLRFHLIIFIISIVVSGISIICGMRKPLQIATNVTPVEATKYKENISLGKGYKRKKGFFFWRMAFEQLKKDKKKTIFVLLSLSISFCIKSGFTISYFKKRSNVSKLKSLVFFLAKLSFIFKNSLKTFVVSFVK